MGSTRYSDTHYSDTRYSDSGVMSIRVEVGAKFGAGAGIGFGIRAQEVRAGLVYELG